MSTESWSHTFSKAGQYCAPQSGPIDLTFAKEKLKLKLQEHALPSRSISCLHHVAANGTWHGRYQILVDAFRCNKHSVHQISRWSSWPKHSTMTAAFWWQRLTTYSAPDIEMGNSALTLEDCVHILLQYHRILYSIILMALGTTWNNFGKVGNLLPTRLQSMPQTAFAGGPRDDDVGCITTCCNFKATC